MPTSLRRQALAWVVLFLPCTFLGAQLLLPPFLGDHMVLQRETSIPIRGSAAPFGEVSLHFHDGSYTATADAQGHWSVQLPPLPAGGPFDLTCASAGDTIRLQDILIGDVWLCSGQSNMEWPLSRTAEAAQALPSAGSGRIRLLRFRKRHSTYAEPYTAEELAAFTAGDFFHPPVWQPCTPETASDFSGVGYFFGRSLHDSLEIPIGLVQQAVGGSPAQAWVSREALASHPDFRALVLPPPGKTWLDAGFLHPWLAVRARENWGGAFPGPDGSPPGHPFAPGYLFEAAVRPLAPLPFRGVIWYQGESNATDPASYPALMELLVRSWRQTLGSDLPFLFVQLPRIGNRSQWAAFRAAQDQGLALPHTGRVVTIDLGHPTDVHPREKLAVGHRLAQLALARTYQFDLPAESPALLSADWPLNGPELLLRTNYAYEGLRTSDGLTPRGFVLQGFTDQGRRETIYEPASVRLEGNLIRIGLPEGMLPCLVKYAWAPFPDNNVTNSAGLPLAPFSAHIPGNQ
jgi:sialate O-acetylesterase